MCKKGLQNQGKTEQVLLESKFCNNLTDTHV